MDPGLRTHSRRVLIVEDQRSFAESLEVVVDSQYDMVCVGSVLTGEAAIERAEQDAPTVVLMDVDLPGIDGVETTARLVDQHPDVKVVMLTGIPDATVLARAASAGACAFLLKDSSVGEILDAIRSNNPRTGRLDVDADAINQMLSADEGDGTQIDHITQRELEVLGLLAQGRQPKEIARTLGISLHTCRGHVKSLLTKLDAHSALEAVVVAHREGLISL